MTDWLDRLRDGTFNGKLERCSGDRIADDVTGAEPLVHLGDANFPVVRVGQRLADSALCL